MKHFIKLCFTSLAVILITIGAQEHNIIAYLCGCAFLGIIVEGD